MVVSLIVLNYDQLIRRFPEGGGAVAATGMAFGEGWAFLPLGALVVDFVLTIAISVATNGAHTWPPIGERPVDRVHRDRRPGPV